MKKFHLLFLSVLSCLLMCSCGKQVCDYCGKEKYCEEFDILGTTRYICEDCLDHPEVAISGNVINDYSTLYETGILTYPTISSDVVSDDQISLNTTISSTLSENSESSNSPEVSEDISVQSSNNSISLDELSAQLTECFTSLGYNLLPVDETNREFVLYKENTDLGIHFVLKKDANTSTLCIEKYTSASSSDYVSACINSALLFLNSTDYNGVGYEVFNCASQYGNYTKDGITFLYLENTEEDINQGAPSISFDISQ